jgi:hypothetical protein
MSVRQEGWPFSRESFSESFFSRNSSNSWIWTLVEMRMMLSARGKRGTDIPRDEMRTSQWFFHNTCSLVSNMPIDSFCLRQGCMEHSIVALLAIWRPAIWQEATVHSVHLSLPSLQKSGYIVELHWLYPKQEVPQSWRQQIRQAFTFSSYYE